jgi:hypothetical protein
MTTIPLIEPAKGVTEETIRRLLRPSMRVLRDDDLGPLFRRALSHRWDEHLAIMVDFWSSIALRTGRYEGSRWPTGAWPCWRASSSAGLPCSRQPRGRSASPMRRSSSSPARTASPTVCRSASISDRRLCTCPARCRRRRSRLRLGSRVLPHSTGPDAGRSPAAPRGASPPGRRWHSRHGRREWGSRTAPPGRRLRQRR